MTLRDFTLMLLICLLWAAHTAVSKIVVSGMEIPSLLYATVRYAIVALLRCLGLFPPHGRPGAFWWSGFSWTGAGSRYSS